MGTSTSSRGIAIAAILFGTMAASGAAIAGPLPAAKAMATNSASDAVQPVRHRGWRGRGWGGFGFYGPSIYIGPRYGYGYGYGYPRYRYSDSYYDGGYSYYRPYRSHNRRWVHRRFEHPLGWR